MTSINFTGGKSVYCINELQMKKALEYSLNDEHMIVRDELDRLISKLSRNELTALAFLIIDNLHSE